MKALSVAPIWGMLLYSGEKTIECRTWKTDYRGPILFCTSQKPVAPYCPSGYALFIADLVDIVPFEEKHLQAAQMPEVPEGQCYAWMIDHIVPIEPFKVKGKLGFFNVDDSLIHRHDPNMTDDEGDEFEEEFIEPIIYKPARL